MGGVPSSPAALPFLALDIGGTSIRAALVQGGEVGQRQQVATPQPAGPDAVIAAAVALARPLTRQPLAGVGVACAGAIRGGVVQSTAEHIFPGWAGTPLAKRLERELAQPVAVLNDARAAAWGEAQAGAGRGVPDFAFVTVSTGIGAGLVLGGRLHLAGNGLDAELGSTLVQTQAGEPRSLEAEAAGRALDEQARRLGWADARALCDAAEAGDPLAQAAYRRSAALLAWKLVDLATLLGVTHVALGGSVGLRPGYRERVRRALADLPARARPEVMPAELGADAGLVGAALWTQGGQA